MKEWYFFGGQYSASNKNYNIDYVNTVQSHDSVIYGFINNDGIFIYKATHRQGLIKTTKFNYVNYVEAIDMCLDTINKNIYILGRTGSRPPLYKFSHGIIYKLDFDLNAIDSTLITYATLYDPTQISLKNDKLYVAGVNANYFNEPGKINISVHGLNLQQLNFKVVSDSSNSRTPKKLLFDSNNNLRLFISANGNTTSPPKTLMLLDTNLNVLDYKCILNRCAPQYPFIFPQQHCKRQLWLYV